MRCGKCGYLSFDSQEKCGHCGRDLGELAGQLGGTGIILEAPQWLAGGLAGEQALAGAAEPEADAVETLTPDPNHDVPVDGAADPAFALEDVTAPALVEVDFGEEISIRDSAAADSPGAAAAGRGDAFPEMDGYGSFDLFDLDERASSTGAGHDLAAEDIGEVEAKAAPASGYRLTEDISDLLGEAEPDVANDASDALYDPTGLDELVLSLDEDQDFPGANEIPAELPDIPDLGLSLESAEEADEEKDK
jgi:hypothetical protein